MVRINLVNPKKLSDQHLIAEYNEILMLIGHIKKFPKINNPPKNYTLGKGHINFFKNKTKYLKARHELIKKEMKIRGFKTNKTIKLSQFKKEQKENWKPKKTDLEIIKKRIISKIKLKTNYYRYYKEKKSAKFLIELLK
ncbi:endonuclease V [archaeon]|jgi:deoxyribonuclease (pyrimidine dimer)|nr:endonuclease V [archaeon]MBT4373577.1 endonuclease V [archaeon]MBT4532025.1 endonuclease V [archaeon]MBT7001692.1 endonuclease V [archaeon]MBT7282416.1 endonuclease V [archaeon]